MAEDRAVLEAPSLLCLASGLGRLKHLESERAGAPWASVSMRFHHFGSPYGGLNVVGHLACWLRALGVSVPTETGISCTSLFKLAVKVMPCHFCHFLFIETVQKTQTCPGVGNIDSVF